MEPASASRKPDRPQRPRRRWSRVLLTVAICPLLIPLVLFALLMTIVVGLPMMFLESTVFEPLRFRRHLTSRGRVITETECLSRLRRGEGTLLIEELGGKHARAWWTPDNVEALPRVDLETIEDDWVDGRMSAEARAIALRTLATLDKYTDLRSGSALVVRRHGGDALARQAQEQGLDARIVRLPAWVADLEFDPRACGRCGYDLTGLAGPVCPECGATVLAGGAEARAT